MKLLRQWVTQCTYNNTKEIWDELRDLCPLYKGATYEKMEGMGYIQWPCTDEGLKIKVRNICIKAKSSTVRTAKLNSLHVTGNHRWKIFQKNSHWYFLPYVKWVTTPAVQWLVTAVHLRTCDEPGFVQMNDQDAKELGIKNNDLVWIASSRGKLFLAQMWALVLTKALVIWPINGGSVNVTN